MVLIVGFNHLTAEYTMSPSTSDVVVPVPCAVSLFGYVNTKPFPSYTTVLSDPAPSILNSGQEFPVGSSTLKSTLDLPPRSEIENA